MHWKSFIFITALIATLALAPVRSFAHASLVAASPQDGATVSSGEVAIELRFNSHIDARLSRLTLVMLDDQRVIEPLKTIPALDGLNAKAPDLREGAYTLHWQILSLDGHLTQGKINFRVGR
jgi:copper resistance protein C